MTPMILDSSPIDTQTISKASTLTSCSDPSVLVSCNASAKTKELWYLHGHPHSKRYSNPDLVTLSALVRHDGVVLKGETAFLYPTSSGIDTPYESMTWDEFDHITETLAVQYGRELEQELKEGNLARKQPTVALLGQGTSIEYFATQLALQKLGLRVLLLAESNAPSALHHLLERCDVCVAIVDSRNRKVDLNGIRVSSMIEILPRENDGSQAEVESLRFQDIGDPWERHTFIIHSSGSTGMPKPIIHTNRSMMLIARMYRLFPEFHAENWFLLFPLYHIAGISIALSGLPNGQILSFPPISWPPSSSSIFAAWKTLEAMGHPVDLTHCAPSLIENMYDYILSSKEKDFGPLARLKALQPGGAALHSDIVAALVAHGVNVKTTYGSTETGPPLRPVPHSHANPKCYSFRNLYPDNPKLKMEEIAEGVYECIVFKGFELAAELWDGKPEDEPYRTNDLFIQDPPGSGLFVLQGRKDDILVHSNGENTTAGPLQLDIQMSSKHIAKAVALGHSKPCVGLLIEVNEDIDGTSDEVRQDIWKSVMKVNEKYPGHSRVMRSMIHFLAKGSSLPVTPKGNVKRKEVEILYANEIAQLYCGLDGSPRPLTIEPLDEPLDEWIRGLFSDLSGTPREEIKDYTTLYSLGIDSRLALSLRASLSSRLGPVSLGTIFEYPTISKLMTLFQTESSTSNVALRSPATEDKYENTNRLISKLTSEFRSWPPRSPHSPAPPPTEHTILLTGASGSLGTCLLSILTSPASSSVKKIYAMIRSGSRQKLYSALQNRGMPADEIMSSCKLEVLDYSMGDPLLGLDIEVYYRLAREVTIVVQNAWKMDFNQGVEDFGADCLRNTMSMLRLCHTGNPKTFAFMSSMSTCLGPSAPARIPELPLGSKLFPASPSHALPTGYAQSKYIVEAITQTASSKLGIPVRMLRVGQMCGDTRTGWWNKDEMWPIMFASGVEMGFLPLLKGVAVDWIPVDVAATSIAEVLFHEFDQASRYTVHNIVNPKPVSWKALIEMVQTAVINTQGEYKSMKEVSMSDWVKKLVAEEDVEKVPGLRLLGFFEGMADNEDKVDGTRELTVFETSETIKISRALRECKAVEKGWVLRWIEQWKRDGFMR